MLTGKAVQDRLWEGFPALRRAIQDKPRGSRETDVRTSVDESAMDRMRRLLEIGMRAQERIDDLRADAWSVGGDENALREARTGLHRDLEELSNQLQSCSHVFNEMSRRVGELHSAIDRRPEATHAGTAEPECRVEVSAADFIPALQALKAAQTRGNQIRVSFQAGSLELTRSVTTVRLPAAGSWPRTAVLPVNFVREMLRRRKELPHTFVITGGQTTLHVSHYWIPCRWVELEKG